MNEMCSLLCMCIVYAICTVLLVLEVTLCEQYMSFLAVLSVKLVLANKCSTAKIKFNEKLEMIFWLCFQFSSE